MTSSAYPAVDLIFTKCALVYGRDFLARWQGLDLNEVKADWAHELGPLLGNHQAIRHALTHLPIDKPPNVFQFRALCIARPIEGRLALARPAPTDDEKEKFREAMARTRDKLMGRTAKTENSPAKPLSTPVADMPMPDMRSLLEQAKDRASGRAAA